MKMSGRINTNAEMSAISEILEESSQLDTLSFHLLVDECKKAIPTFAQLCQEYDLSLESCQTTGFTADLSFDEWAAYKHPVNSVTTYKKNTVEINNTGRTVTYLSAPLKQGNHINSYSYVRVNDEEDDWSHKNVFCPYFFRHRHKVCHSANLSRSSTRL